jgi:hypothetical protein
MYRRMVSSLADGDTQFSISSNFSDGAEVVGVMMMKNRIDEAIKVMMELKI